MHSLTLLAGALVCGAVLALGAHLINRIQGGFARPLPSISLFCTGAGLWQLAFAMAADLDRSTRLNVIFAGFFFLLGAVAQIAPALRRRSMVRRRAPNA
jgi:hypothetical protein